jgi:hypothetical protein
VPAAAFESVNVSAGVVVGVATLVVNSGERFPELNDVTVPAVGQKKANPLQVSVHPNVTLKNVPPGTGI